MRALDRRFRFLAAAAAVATLLAAAPFARAATITIINADGAGEGFNDATPAAPIGGNPGVTIGQQRLNVFQQAASIWGALLPSAVTINVRAQFNPQSCNATSGVLGSAGPAVIVRDFAGAIFPGTWYHVALANKLAGIDLDPPTHDINATFNVSIGSATCLTVGWYYGLDGNEGIQIELLPVVLHELGHGLGFSTSTNGSTGNFNSGFPTAYDHFLYDNVTGGHWHTMTAAERQASAISCGKLAWDGPYVVAGAPARLGPKEILRVNAPGGIAGDYGVGTAAFGPPLSSPGVTGDVVLAEDAVAPINDGCETPFVNAAALVGKIALIDRGLCGFVIKVKNAQDAGAIAVIIADNVAGCPPPGLGGADPTITIPAIRVSQADGNLLKANLLAGLNVTLGVDNTKDAGTDAGGRVLVYTPNPFASGSSVSHFDVSASPNVLMEPAINNDLSSDVDLTLNQMADIGWLQLPVAVQVAPGKVFAEAGRIRVEFYTSEASSRMWTAYRREGNEDWTAMGSPFAMGNGLLIVDDTSVAPGGRYAYRVGAIGDNGQMEYSSEVWATVPSDLVFALDGARPNPAVGPLTVSFALPSSAPAHLELVNVAGRVVKSMEVGSRGAGRHTVPLDLQGELKSGVYFLRLTQGTRSLKAPVVVL